MNSDKSMEQHLKENLIDLSDYDAAKERLILRLVSKELNNYFLKDKLYVKVPDTDLVAVFYVLVEISEMVYHQQLCQKIIQVCGALRR